MTLTKDQHREAMYGLCIARITDAADGRMKLRTAKEQHAAVLAELQRERDEVVPDSNQDSDLRNNVLR